MALLILEKNHRQRGMALILAIGFLAILSILGAVVLDVATRDLQGSATSMPARRALYAADRAVEYAMNRDIVVTLVEGDEINLIVDDVKEVTPLAPAGLKHHTLIDESGGGQLVSGTIRDLGVRDLPPSVAELYGSEFGANLYHVQVESRGPSNTQSHVNASIVRLFKMDDDTIFRTTGGG